MKNLKPSSIMEAVDRKKLRGCSIGHMIFGIILISCNVVNITQSGSPLDFWFSIWSLSLSVFPLIAGLIGATSHSQAKLLGFMVLNVISAVTSLLSVIGTIFVVYFGGFYFVYVNLYDNLYLRMLFAVGVINLMECIMSVYCSIFSGRFLACGSESEIKTSNDAKQMSTVDRKNLKGSSIAHIIFGILLITCNVVNIEQARMSGCIDCYGNPSLLQLWFSIFAFSLSVFPLVTGLLGATSPSRGKLMGFLVLNIITAVTNVLINIGSVFIVIFGGGCNGLYAPILFVVWNFNLVECIMSVCCSIFSGSIIVSCESENKTSNDDDTAKNLSLLMTKNKQVSVEPWTTSMKNQLSHYQNIYKL